MPTDSTHVRRLAIMPIFEGFPDSGLHAGQVYAVEGIAEVMCTCGQCEPRGRECWMLWDNVGVIRQCCVNAN